MLQKYKKNMNMPDKLQIIFVSLHDN